MMTLKQHIAQWRYEQGEIDYPARHRRDPQELSPILKAHLAKWEGERRRLRDMSRDKLV